MLLLVFFLFSFIVFSIDNFAFAAAEDFFFVVADVLVLVECADFASLATVVDVATAHASFIPFISGVAEIIVPGANLR